MDKTCIECEDIKDINLFVKNRNLCKECMKRYKGLYHSKNKEKISQFKKEVYILKRKELLLKRKEHYIKNKESKLKYQKKYASLNKEKISEYKMDYQRNRRKNDPIFRLKYIVGRIIRNSLKCKGLSKNKKSIEILGCSIEFFKVYMEGKFTNEMNWDNYGKIWDIDHIIPLATSITKKDVLRLNHYTNLQPLNSHINRNIKRDKIDFYENF